MWLIRDCVAVTENVDFGARPRELNPGSAASWLCLGVVICK